MEMHQLRYFLAVVRTQNFSRAAQECHVAQPSLSQQIRKLEEELGEPLFFRRPQGAILTDAGNLLLPHAQQVLREVAQAQRTISQSGAAVKGRLVLGVLPTIAPYLLPRLLDTYHRRYPEVEVTVQEEITPRLLGELTEGGMDLALLSLPVDTGAEQLIFEEELLLVLPEDHPFTALETVPIKELSGERFILMQDGHCLAGQALELCFTHGDFTPRISCRSAQVETLLEMVRCGLGISIIPRMAARPADGLLFRSFSGAPPLRKVGFAWQRDRFWPAAGKAMVDLGLEMLPGIFGMAAATPCLP